MASFWEGRKVLVTGGAGFVGQYLVKDLLAERATVTVVDDLSRGKEERLEGLDIAFCEYDLTQPELAFDVCRGMDTVFHLASPVGGLYYNIGRQYMMFAEAMKSTINIVDGCIGHGVRHLALASSACVYPPGTPIPMKEDATTDGPPEPGSEGYGWAKRMSEFIAGWLMEESAMKVTVFRPANAIGPDDIDDETSHVIPALLRRIMEGQDPLVVYGSGNQLREFLHARDYARGAMACMERGADGRVINLGSGNAITIAELARKLLDLCGHPERAITFDTSKPEGHVAKLHNLTRLKEDVGFVAEIGLDEALKEIVDDYVSRWNADPSNRLHEGQAATVSGAPGVS